jgi:alpha-L-rhamnosidase
MSANKPYTVKLKSLQQTEVLPVETSLLDDGTLFVDFGKAAFGTIVIPFKKGRARTSVTAHLGEKLNDKEKRIDRSPPGTIRYICIEQEVAKNEGQCRIIIPPDERNTGLNAIKMPPYIGEIIPFRYAEIENGKDVDTTSLHQIFVHYPFDDAAAEFNSSDNVLNEVWDLCKYSIKATTFCGVYVDGDRERIPYEGDAYINQLGHYCVDSEYDFARYSHEYMIQNPTWCTEWHLHSVMMAYMDYLYSGEKKSLETFYEELCIKTLMDFSREDGLISVDPELRTPQMEQRLAPSFANGIIKDNIRDVVDWPPGSFTNGGTGERDDHEIMPVNTVVNAFHCHTLNLMSRIARSLGKYEDSKMFAQRAEKVKKQIDSLLFDDNRGVYLDGEGSSHASLHSNMFMLAFELVSDERRKSVLKFIKSRGMACSVYGAQHLLEALYLNGEGEYALELMRDTNDRSWWNMIQAGSTMALEAWDIKYKNNLDWNHAWGAAPANIIPRFLLGVRPLDPGFSKILINPQPGKLESVNGVVPTPLGPVTVNIENEEGKPFELRVEIPEDAEAKIVIPNEFAGAAKVLINGKSVVY